MTEQALLHVEQGTDAAMNANNRVVFRPTAPIEVVRAVAINTDAATTPAIVFTVHIRTASGAATDPVGESLDTFTMPDAADEDTGVDWIPAEKLHVYPNEQIVINGAGASATTGTVAVHYRHMAFQDADTRSRNDVVDVNVTEHPGQISNTEALSAMTQVTS